MLDSADGKKDLATSKSYGHRVKFNYFTFGLHFRSALNLPGLPPGPASSSPDIIIDYGHVPDHLPFATGRGESFEISATDCLLNVPGVARYRISNGCTITIDPASASSQDEIRRVICAAALGVLFHQRGLLPVHASAIETPDGCLAFTGPSHAGKSTLAAYLQERGYPVVADDVCPLSYAPGQETRVYPGLPGLRLWKDALTRFGQADGQHQRISQAMDKFQVAPARIAIPPVMPCAGIVQIGSPDRHQPEPFQRLRGLDAVAVIIEETFWGNFIDHIGKTGSQFQTAAGIANQIPIYRCNLHKTWERMDAFWEFVRRRFGAVNG